MCNELNNIEEKLYGKKINALGIMNIQRKYSKLPLYSEYGYPWFVIHDIVDDNLLIDNNKFISMNDSRYVYTWIIKRNQSKL